MELCRCFKSIVELDEAAVVLCDVNHKIIYMNPAAIKRYAKRGGAKLLGRNLLDCHNENSCGIIKDCLKRFEEDISCNKIYTYHNTRNGENCDCYIVAVRDDDGGLIGYYEKFESRTLEEEKQCTN